MLMNIIIFWKKSTGLLFKSASTQRYGFKY